MSQPEVFILVNPYSRFGFALKIAREVARAISRGKLKGKIRLVRKEEKIGDIIQEIDDHYKYIVIVGGDGTVNSAVKSVIENGKKHLLTTLLGGTGGELARYSKIITVHDLILSLKAGKITPIDVFKADIELEKRNEEHVIVANLQIGHFSQGVKETPLISKRLFSGNGYMVGVLKALVKRVNKTSIVEISGKTVYEGLIFAIHLGNLKTTRGGIEIAPLASPHDGKIDMLLVKNINRIEALKALPLVLQGKHLKHPAVIYLQQKEYNIYLDRDHLAVDGEYLGLAKELKIRHLTKLNILVAHDRII